LAGTLSTLSLDDTVFITRAESSFGQIWTKEDLRESRESPKGGDYAPPPPSPAARVTATTWEKVLEYAVERPLVRLQLLTTTPATAAALVNLAQPLGADSLALTVSVGGPLKEGGTLNFAANDLKPNHPTKPLAIAQILFNALGEGANYEVVLGLNFGAMGRTGLEAQLKSIAEGAPEGVNPTAIFEKPVGGGK
jgi:hypothetical protein